MTNEEAIERYTSNAEYERTHGNLQGYLEFKQLAEWLKDYKRLLEQQSREDCISRQAAIDEAFEVDTKEYGRIDVVGVDAIEALPPITPQPKTGHWIDDNENEIDAQYGRHLYRCSKCNEYADMFVGGTEDWWDIEKPNYCPNCGCRMVEPHESEDKK